MKYFKLFIVLLFLVSCTGMPDILPNTPSVCDQDGSDMSHICKVCAGLNVQAEDIDLLLRLAAIRTMRDIDKRTAIQFLDDADIFVRHTAGLTYRYLIRNIQDYADLTDPEVLLLSRYLPQFDSAQYISRFDRDLILKHIKNQRGILNE